MAKVMLLGGRPILVGGRVAMSSACCCGAGGGACCHIDGSCDIETSANCLAGGGAYQGDGTNCGGVNCTHTGACCLVSSCSIKTQSGCIGTGGTYQGDDTNCAVNPCPGGCCIDGMCSLETESVCEGMSGTWFQGTCSPSPCLSGACCQSNGSCLDDIPEGDCTVESGGVFWQGAGSHCADTPCGACCIGLDDCIITPESPCNLTYGDGNWKGAGTDCDPIPCDGSCCNGAWCAITTSAECTALQSNCNPGGFGCADGYAFQLATSCSPNPCCVGPDCGACCLTGVGFCCYQTNATECATWPGIYHADGGCCHSGCCNDAVSCTP